MEYQSPNFFWAILGIALLIAEVISFTFVLLFFGVSALVVFGIKFFGFSNLSVEILIFALGGIAGVLTFRKKLKINFSSQKELTTDVHTKIILSADVPAHGRARINYQGTSWTAVNETDYSFKIGDEVVISRTEGIDLYIVNV